MWYHDLFTQQHAKLPNTGNGWLAQARNKHMAEFSQQGFPTRRQEDWKYTDLSSLNEVSYHLSAVTSNSQAKALAAKHTISLDYPQLIFVNGQFDSELSSCQLPDSVLATDLATATKKHTALIKTHLGKAISPKAHKLMSFNTALMTSGVVLHIPDNIQLTQPIHCLFINTHKDTHNLACYRNLIVIGKNAQVDIIEHYVGDDTHYLTNSITEIFTAENSQINHTRYQLESDTATHLASVHCSQAQHSQYNNYTFSLGSHLERYDIHSQFQAAHAHCKLYGLTLANQSQHIDNHIRVDHLMPHGSSQQHYKGIYTDKSRGVFNGKVLVAKDAQHTDAQQSNKNILLSPQAEIDTKPELEIYADDVKCSHGATVGELDDKALFYLRSRGIPKIQAQLLLIDAFTHEISDNIPSPASKKYIQEIIAKKLKHIL